MNKITPMMEQYLRIKAQYPETILFFRLGDFYEMFLEDAVLASRELEIVLTSRDNNVPMCGIPYHAVDNYLSKLLSNGHKVAICEQTENPKSTTGIVKREVVRVVTPGTILDNSLLDESKHNFLAAVVEADNSAGLAYIDISTGDFWATALEQSFEDQLFSELSRINPREILLVPESVSYDLIAAKNSSRQFLLETISIDVLNREYAHTLISETLDEKPEEILANSAMTSACAAIIQFLKDTQKTPLHHIKRIRTYNDWGYLQLDSFSRRNLELTANLRNQQKSGTLLGVLDHCVTAMGKRMLRNFIEQPLIQVNHINERLDTVEELKNDLASRTALIAALKQVYDIERLAARVGSSLANPHDLLALKHSLNALPAAKAAVLNMQSSILRKFAALDMLTDLQDLLERAVDEQAPLTIREGHIIKEGFSAEIDELRKMTEQGQDFLLNLEAEEKQKTGIKFLKIGYSRAFGYYIEVSKSNLNLVPAYYVRKQTLVNTERYITDELKQFEDKILGARERLFNLEYETFLQIRTSLAPFIVPLQELAASVAQLDVLSNLAEIAYTRHYTRPQLQNKDNITIKNGRHPVVEENLVSERFVPNDVNLNTSDRRFAIITGPNMGGKSTYMRQLAVLVIMAQMGSFIPADSAVIGIVDRIFTRVGAADDLAGGQSTFMTEMLELAAIIAHATPKSLIILDEVGRGTSTHDGLSIAQAASEYIHSKIKARTLFATHYHELTDLENDYEGIFNLSVSVLETDTQISFLKKVLPGRANKSYGIHVAELAGLPQPLIRRARKLLKNWEQQQYQPQSSWTIQASLFPEASDNLKDRLQALNLDELSPKEALSLLYIWQEMLK